MRIEINGINKEVVVTRKKMKNMVLRVSEYGTICVSCPYHVTDEQILSFLNSKKEWILESERMQEKKRNQMQFGSEGKVTFFGETYPVVIKQGFENTVELKDGTFVFSLSDQEEALIFEVFYTYAGQYLAAELKKMRSMLDKEICHKKGKRGPKISLKYMKSRWGSCTPSTNSISISLRLIHFPKKCLEYVLIHEYVHLLIPNHSKEFYAKVSEYMPDYQVYKDMLNH